MQYKHFLLVLSSGGVRVSSLIAQLCTLLAWRNEVQCYGIIMAKLKIEGSPLRARRTDKWGWKLYSDFVRAL